MENGRVLIPRKAFSFEILGYEVQWDPEYRAIVATYLSEDGKFSDSLVMWIGIPNARHEFYDWDYAKQDFNHDTFDLPMDVPPRIVNGSTLVPLRFANWSLGYQVKFDKAKNQITVCLTEPSEADENTPVSETSNVDTTKLYELYDNNTNPYPGAFQ